MKTQVAKKFVQTLVDVFDQFSINAEVTSEYSHSANLEMYVYVQLPDDCYFNLRFDIVQFLKAYCSMLSYHAEQCLIVKEGYKDNQLYIF